MKIKNLILSLVLSSSSSLWAACPESWEGSYFWEESVEHSSGEMNNFWEYSLDIFNSDGKCEAELRGDGNQMQKHILADVQGDDKEISIIYRQMGEEAGFGSAGEKGDILFKLKWVEPESDNPALITHWEKMQPQLEKHSQDGNYFAPSEAAFVEVEVGKATEKGTPLTFTALTDLNLEFRDGVEADLDNMAWWEKKPKLSKKLKEGEKYSFDFLPAGDIPNLAICADVEVDVSCWFPSFSGKDGSLEGLGNGFVLKE